MSDIVEIIISRIGEEFDDECHLTEAEARLAASEIERLRKALEPFANAVFNDNGDMTVNLSVDSEDLINAYFVLRRAALTEGKEGGEE